MLSKKVRYQKISFHKWIRFLRFKNDSEYEYAVIRQIRLLYK